MITENGITRETQENIHTNAINHGFWDGPANLAEKIALIHSEASEALEELRETEPDLEHVGEELADVMIRCLDLAGHLDLDLVEAVFAKMDRNLDRPYRHGKRF